MKNYVQMTELVGKTFSSVEGKVGGDELRFITVEGEIYLMYHGQDCCEEVWLEDIVGELEDLVDTPILEATEDASSDEPPLGESYEQPGRKPPTLVVGMNAL